MRETRKVHTVFLGVQNFHLSGGRMETGEWSVHARGPQDGRNSLAGFTIIQSERLVLRCRDTLVPAVIKAQSCDVSRTLLSCWRARATLSSRGGRWRTRINGTLEDFSSLQPALTDNLSQDTQARHPEASTMMETVSARGGGWSLLLVVVGGGGGMREAM